MTDAPRRIAATRKVSLADFADDWQDCHAVVRLATLEEFRETTEKDFTALKTSEVIDYEVQFVKDHFVSGRLKELGGDELVDMLADDITAVPPLPDYLYTVILGLDIDPKGLRKAAQAMSMPSNDSSTTKTQSSTESSETPQLTS